MNRRLLFGLLLLALGAPALALTGRAAGARRWNYQLVEGSTFVNDCPVCGRPSRPLPMRGSFQLELVEANPLVTRYALRNVAFTADAGTGVPIPITGQGTYEVGGEVVVQQSLGLQVRVGDAPDVYALTNGDPTVTALWPMLAGSGHTQVSLTLAYTLQLVAAPVQEIWFSTAGDFTSGNRPPPLNRLSRADVLASNGRAVKPQDELLANLGLMPGTGVSVGLDALDVAPGGEMLFSLDVDVFSETLGPLHHGDLLSDRGRVVRVNSDLLAKFGRPPPIADAGLDAVQVQPTGETYFSIGTDTPSGALGVILHHGDLLSDRGAIVRTGPQLLSRFHPSISDHDYGLDALHVWPSGEIWFSTAEGFTGKQLGFVGPGDLLSDQGTVIFRNLELVGAFQPVEDVSNFGLDALFVVTDTASPEPGASLALRRVKLGAPGEYLEVSWDSPGRVFQLLSAGDVAGPFVPLTPLTTRTVQTAPFRLPDGAPASNSFFRVRQW